MKHCTNKKRPIKLGIAVTVVAALSAMTLATASCAPSSLNESEQGGKADATYQDWVAAYPDQYASFLTDKWRDGGGGYKTDGQYNHTHSMLRQNMEDMFETIEVDQPGYMKLSCIACKSSAYNDIYEKYGEQTFELGLGEINLDEVMESAWDCETCHESIDDLTLRPGISTWDELSEGAFDNQAPETLVCAQCHNSWGNIVKFAAGDERGLTIQDYHPYQYGYDADALYKEYAEDGSTRVQFDENGLVLVNTTTYDIENFAGSVHQNLGMTCASCHMPTQENGNKEEYTSHNASGSVLENVTALEYCLTCHEAQGIESTDEMVEYVHAAQSNFADKKAEVDAMLAQLKETLLTVIEDGSVDEATLDQARDKYNLATYYVSYAASYVHGRDGVKIAHNPEGMINYVERARNMAQESIDLLA
ncbi:ammonia-forming cytochrome c nitrite reductase subunit c552 [Arabiibacter massiliensis]|uniref:ammonia-forming cytochrome c nitrite reductase subunit c552 n=1 Tax=Arabiibacter massiliensis TaxID=1870985 RepID=UPI00155AD970|nr:ammonia-forming cytochrome c nitrite reductase subunit c552 [Arabiibacter massiliensis]